MINRQLGCEFAYTEMIDTRSLCYGSKATRRTAQIRPDDKPLGIQILGEEPEYIRKSLEILKDYDFDAVDFNAACPTKKVVNKGKGAALLQNPRKLHDLLKLAVQHSPIPFVTVKLRLGWNDVSSAQDIARYAEDAGVSAIFIHGRTRMQGYRGTVDYDSIRGVKKAVKVPVIASGDILSAQLAKKMFDETGCDALIVARGALGNPWIFREIKAFLETGVEIARPSVEEIADTMKEHLQMCIACFKEER
ncbi:MAG: tRNA-dihydrouridine synthase family protein, partial [Candidatus Omnitrophica bacterium]|nr:tRNA-dihydrouridine synthase family protein [Candidatus Omnitrophota bacterium]